MSRNLDQTFGEYRYRNHAEPGSPMRQITLSAIKYPTEAKALIQLQEELLRINTPRVLPAAECAHAGAGH